MTAEARTTITVIPLFEGFDVMLIYYSEAVFQQSEQFCRLAGHFLPHGGQLGAPSFLYDFFMSKRNTASRSGQGNYHKLFRNLGGPLSARSC